MCSSWWTPGKAGDAHTRADMPSAVRARGLADPGAAVHLTWSAGQIDSVRRIGAGDAKALVASGAADCRGMHAVPGFVDAHLHMTLGSLGLSKCQLAGCSTRADFESRIAAHAATLSPGEWLEAQGWDEACWGGAQPDASWLSSAGERPAVAYRMDIHACVVNHVLLRMLRERGALKAEPPGGTIVRDAHGAPTGLLQEQAAWMIVNPMVPPPSEARRRDALVRGSAYLLARGVTAAGSMEYARDVREAMLPLAREAARGGPSGLQMPHVRVTLLDRTLPLDLGWAAEAEVPGVLRIIGAKSFADGTLGSRTAAMSAPYEGSEGQGSLIELAAAGRLAEWMREVVAAGLSPSVHAIGDAAVGATLDAAAAAAIPPETLRIEHVQVLADRDVPRLKGCIASMQPLHAASDMPGVASRLGSMRERLLFRYRDILGSGATLAFGSDWPVVEPDPMAAIRSAVTGLADDGQRYGASQLLSAAEALDAHTRGAARCLGLWPGAGQLAPGARADIALLDRDPLAADWGSAPPQVAATVAAGRLTRTAVR